MTDEDILKLATEPLPSELEAAVRAAHYAGKAGVSLDDTIASIQAGRALIVHVGLDTVAEIVTQNWGKQK